MASMDLSCGGRCKWGLGPHGQSERQESMEVSCQQRWWVWVHNELPRFSISFYFICLVNISSSEFFQRYTDAKVCPLEFARMFAAWPWIPSLQFSQCGQGIVGRPELPADEGLGVDWAILRSTRSTMPFALHCKRWRKYLGTRKDAGGCSGGWWCQSFGGWKWKQVRRLLH